jgi:hypothetical protein
MEEDTKTAINRIVIELSKEGGEVLLLTQIVKRAAEENIAEKDVQAELKTLAGEGIITQLDDESIKLNM